MLLNCGVGEDSWIPWTARRSNQSILKEISPEYSSEGLILKRKLQYFGYLMRKTDSFKKTLMLGKIKEERRRGWERMRWLNGIGDAMDMNLRSSRSWWWTRKPGILQCTGPQRTGHNWVTELNWTELDAYMLRILHKFLAHNYYQKWLPLLYEIRTYFTK